MKLEHPFTNNGGHMKDITKYGNLPFSIAQLVLIERKNPIYTRTVLTKLLYIEDLTHTCIYLNIYGGYA